MVGIRRLLSDFPWIHISLGIAGNLTFFVGSILFLSPATEIFGVWLFIVGSFGMLVGALGEALVRYERHQLNI